jgi:hypothetical protein
MKARDSLTPFGMTLEKTYYILKGTAPHHVTKEIFSVKTKGYSPADESAGLADALRDDVLNERDILNYARKLRVEESQCGEFRTAPYAND